MWSGLQAKKNYVLLIIEKKETWIIDEDDATVNYLKEKVIVIIVIITAKALTNEQNLWNEDLLDDLENKYLFIKFLFIIFKVYEFVLLPMLGIRKM